MIRPIQQFTDHSRANILLRQQQLRQRDGWHFEAMSLAEYNQLDTDPLWMDAVYDHEQGGVWWRKKSAMAKADRQPLAQKTNRYDRPVTRFGDLMSGLSRIAKGLQEIDHATDGDFGESIFDLLR
jgi:hypothetical protein